MIITGVEFKRALIIEGIEVPQIGKSGWDGNGLFLSCLAIEDFHFIPVGFQGSSEIGEANRLRPNGCLIEILNGWLNQEDLHSIYKKAKISIINCSSIV
jgi:hypothetical protein